MTHFSRREQARAKINLTLHVGPPSGDGYHPLRSLVAFADIGDVVELHPSKGSESTLTIGGPFAEGLESNDKNFVLRAANLISTRKFDFKLIKNLPIASGIGGGSADAAAAIRLICKFEDISPNQYMRKAADIGSDIPVCVTSETSLMEGRGEQLTPISDLGTIHAVLVNPGVAVSTRSVFKLFDKTDPKISNLSTTYSPLSNLLDLALQGRNDLQEITLSMIPDIMTVLNALNAQANCQLARMSGSGATCFGLFATKDAAFKAQEEIATRHPDWWCVQTILGDQP